MTIRYGCRRHHGRAIQGEWKPSWLKNLTGLLDDNVHFKNLCLRALKGARKTTLLNLKKLAFGFTPKGFTPATKEASFLPYTRAILKNFKLHTTVTWYRQEKWASIKDIITCTLPFKLCNLEALLQHPSHVTQLRSVAINCTNKILWNRLERCCCPHWLIYFL